MVDASLPEVDEQLCYSSSPACWIVSCSLVSWPASNGTRSSALEVPRTVRPESGTKCKPLPTPGAPGHRAGLRN